MHNMQMTVGLSTVFSKIIVFMGILIFVLLSSFPFVSTTTYTMSQTKIATGADTPSIAAFKTMPSLEGDTAETWREFFSSFRHHANLGGQMYADVLDLTNVSKSSLSRPHDQFLFAVLAIAIGKGIKCPSAKEILDKVDVSSYSARDALGLMNDHYGSAGALRQSIILSDLLDLDYTNLGHVEYKRKFYECVRLMPGIKFPKILLRGLVLKALPSLPTDQGHSWFNFKLIQNTQAHENDSVDDLFSSLDDIHKSLMASTNSKEMVLFTGAKSVVKQKLVVSPARPGGNPGAMKCSHCGRRRHEADKCFNLHPNLAPPGWIAKPAASKGSPAKANSAQTNSVQTMSTMLPSTKRLLMSLVDSIKEEEYEFNASVTIIQGFGSKIPVDSNLLRLDSCASRHMTASIDDVTDYKPYKQGSNQVKVEVASGALLDAIGEGILHKTLKGNGNSKIHVKFQRTLIVPGLCSTLICLMQMLTPGENESECDLHIVKGRASLNCFR